MVSRPNASTPEQRSALRIPAARVPSIEGIRISPGDTISTLVNISTSGVLVECSSKPRPGSTVIVHFLGTFTPDSIRGRVARTIVASLGRDGVLRYMVGIAFENPIDLDAAIASVNVPEAAPIPPLALTSAPEFVEPVPRIASRLQNRW